MNNYNYSVRVKNGSGWRQYSTVRLMISVGQEYHEGEKFAAVTDWINRNPDIKNVHISVNDTLQRYNFFSDSVSSERAYQISRAAGDMWIARNEPAIKNIKVNTIITRWDDWTTGSEFIDTTEALSQLNKNSKTFAKSVERDAQTFLMRRKKRNDLQVSDEDFLYFSKHYLIEELAIFSLQVKGLPAAEIYPGSNLQSAEQLQREALPEVSDCQWLKDTLHA